MRERESKVSLLFFVLLFGFAGLYAQDPVFITNVSSATIQQNTVFEVQFELQNANGQDFQPPDLSKFTIAGGPAMSSSTVIINGKVSRSESWVYSLIATRPGTYTIGSASVISGRRKLTTKPISIRVVEAKDLPSSGTRIPGQGPIRLIAHVEPGDYYPGQQIVLSYKLLFTENIQSVNTMSEDDYADFFIQPFNSFSKEATYESINDVTYVSRTIRALSLFAHQSGTYTIDPMVIMATITGPAPGNQGFFAMRRMHNIQVASEPLTIRILPLPPDVSPSDFSGAVGRYELTTLHHSATQITTDDDFTVRIEIKGDGDARRWDPPAATTDGPFEIYDPRIVDDKTLDADGAVMHVRAIEYSMIPQEEGEFNIVIPFRFFDPVLRSYRTIQSDTFTISVARGTNQPRAARTDTSALHPPPLRKVNAYKLNDRFWMSLPHLLLFGLVLGGSAWGLVLWYRKKRDEEIPAAERMRSASSRLARHELDVLEKKMDELDNPTFFEKYTEIYYRFIAEKYGIPPADLDEGKLRSYLASHKVPDNLQQNAIRHFNECLVLRYAGIPTGSSKGELISTGRRLIDELDQASHHI